MDRTTADNDRHELHQRVVQHGGTIVRAARQIQDLAAEIHRLNIQILEVEELGTVDAGLHWRQDKYLYLIHRTDPHTGNRRREYIGNKPEKIREAVDRVDRHNYRGQLLAQRQSTAGRLERLFSAIRALEPHLPA